MVQLFRVSLSHKCMSINTTVKHFVVLKSGLSQMAYMRPRAPGWAATIPDYMNCRGSTITARNIARDGQAHVRGFQEEVHACGLVGRWGTWGHGREEIVYDMANVRHRASYAKGSGCLSCCTVFGSLSSPDNRSRRGSVFSAPYMIRSTSSGSPFTPTPKVATT